MAPPLGPVVVDTAEGTFGAAGATGPAQEGLPEELPEEPPEEPPEELPEELPAGGSTGSCPTGPAPMRRSCWRSWSLASASVARRALNAAASGSSRITESSSG